MATCSAQELIDSAKCFMCLDMKQLAAVRASLLCQIASGGLGGGGGMSNGITWTPSPTTSAAMRGPYMQRTGVEYTYPVLISSTGNLDWSLDLFMKALTMTALSIIDHDFDVHGCTSLETLDVGELFSVGGNFKCYGCTDLTSIDIAKLQQVGDFLAYGCFVLAGIDLSSLALVSGGISFADNTLMASLDLGALSSVAGGFSIANCANLTSIDVGTLASVGGSIQAYGCTALTALNLANLTSIGNDFNFWSCPALSSINVAALQTVGGVVGAYDLAITSLNLTALTTVTGDIMVSTCPNLTSIVCPNWVPTNGTGIDFSFNALDVTTVNLILARCVAAGVTTCTINLSAGTSAAPAGQGIADSAALTLAGNTVITN